MPVQQISNFIQTETPKLLKSILTIDKRIVTVALGIAFGAWALREGFLFGEDRRFTAFLQKLTLMDQSQLSLALESLEEKLTTLKISKNTTQSCTWTAPPPSSSPATGTGELSVPKNVYDYLSPLFRYYSTENLFLDYFKFSSNPLYYSLKKLTSNTDSSLPSPYSRFGTKQQEQALAFTILPFLFVSGYALIFRTPKSIAILTTLLKVYGVVAGSMLLGFAAGFGAEYGYYRLSKTTN